jgi:hypothetical protein
MTTSADSERTAKAREQACKLLFGPHWEAIWATPINELSSEAQKEIAHYTEKLLAFAASERQAVIEECAKLCCEICANGGDLPVKRGNDWTHLGVMPGEYVFCGANEVNELRFNGQ